MPAERCTVADTDMGTCTGAGADAQAQAQTYKHKHRHRHTHTHAAPCTHIQHGREMKHMRSAMERGRESVRARERERAGQWERARARGRERRGTRERGRESARERGVVCVHCVWISTHKTTRCVRACTAGMRVHVGHGVYECMRLCVYARVRRGVYACLHRWCAASRDLFRPMGMSHAITRMSVTSR